MDGSRSGRIVHVTEPSQRQVAHTGAKHHSQEHPPIVRHDDQHEEVAQAHLKQLEQSLKRVQDKDECFGHRRSGGGGGGRGERRREGGMKRRGGGKGKE